MFLLPPSATTGRTDMGPSTDTLVLIPLVVVDSSQVSSFIVAKATADSVYLRLVRGDRYAYYGKTLDLDEISAEFVSIHMMMLDYMVFGHNEFRINDLELFKFPGASATNESRFISFDSAYFSETDIGQGRTNTAIAGWYPVNIYFCMDA